MKNIIFYFSGTGNSLAVARDIADKTQKRNQYRHPEVKVSDLIAD